jgi:predicted transcriptional regulator
VRRKKPEAAIATCKGLCDNYYSIVITINSANTTACTIGEPSRETWTTSTSDDHHIVPEDVPQRVKEIAMLRGLGYSFREIGEKLSVTPQAVSLMLARHRRAAKSLDKTVQLRGLSSRAVNALGRHSIRTREEGLQRNILSILPYERNCGSKTVNEIERWLTS